VHIEPLTVDGPVAALEAYHHLRAAESREQTPEIDPPGSLEDCASDVDPTLSADRRGFIARNSTGAPTGFAVLWCGLTHNTHLIDAEIYVAPEHRRNGVGQTLLETVVADADATGRTIIDAGVRIGGAGSAFARGLGATVGLMDRRSTLDVTALDIDDISGLAAKPVPGYELVRWRDECPDEFMDGYIAVIDAMNTAPRGDLSIEDHQVTVAEIRSNEARRARAKARSYTIAARSVATGEFAGFSELLVPSSRPGTGLQEETAVIPAHRGHGLGLVLKAAMLCWLRDTEPDLRVIQTWNAASNAHMLRVNRRLGFVAREDWELVEVPVATVRARLDDMKGTLPPE